MFCLHLIFINVFACRYITYSKEEEAVRCIQSVHGFVLEGKALKYVNQSSFNCVLSLMAIMCGLTLL